MTNIELQEKLKQYPDDELIMLDIKEWEIGNEKIPYPVLKFVNGRVTIWVIHNGFASSDEFQEGTE